MRSKLFLFLSFNSQMLNPYEISSAWQNSFLESGSLMKKNPEKTIKFILSVFLNPLILVNPFFYISKIIPRRVLTPTSDMKYLIGVETETFCRDRCKIGVAAVGLSSQSRITSLIQTFHNSYESTADIQNVNIEPRFDEQNMFSSKLFTKTNSKLLFLKFGA